MNTRALKAVIFGVVLAVALTTVAAGAGPYEDARDAYDSGDYAMALRLLRPLAAEQGNAKAQTALGILYQNGRGVPQDYAEGVKWYRLAAEQGYALAVQSRSVVYRV